MNEVTQERTKHRGRNHRSSFGDNQHGRPYFLDARICIEKPPAARIHGSQQLLLLSQHEGRQTCSNLRSVGGNGAVYFPDERLTIQIREMLLIDYLHVEFMQGMTEGLGEEVVCGANDHTVTVSRHIVSLAARASV